MITPDEKLTAILAKCKANLALADKRTPGEWIVSKTSYGIPATFRHDDTHAVALFGIYKQGEPIIGLRDFQENANFICACAGSAESGWRSTIAAIEGLQAAETLIYSVQNDYDESPPKWWTEQRDKVMAAKSEILSTWPDELLQ